MEWLLVLILVIVLVGALVGAAGAIQSRRRRGGVIGLDRRGRRSRR